MEAGPDGITGGGRSGMMATAILNSPVTVVGCRIAMGVTMALMLFLMINKAALRRGGRGKLVFPAAAAC